MFLNRIVVKSSGICILSYLFYIVLYFYNLLFFFLMVFLSREIILEGFFVLNIVLLVIIILVFVFVVWLIVLGFSLLLILMFKFGYCFCNFFILGSLEVMNCWLLNLGLIVIIKIIYFWISNNFVSNCGDINLY